MSWWCNFLLFLWSFDKKKSPATGDTWEQLYILPLYSAMWGYGSLRNLISLSGPNSLPDFAKRKLLLSVSICSKMGIGTNRLGISPPMYKHVQRDKPVRSELWYKSIKKNYRFLWYFWHLVEYGTKVKLGQECKI